MLIRLSNSGGMTVPIEAQSAPQPPQVTSKSASGFWITE